MESVARSFNAEAEPDLATEVPVAIRFKVTGNLVG